MRLTDAFHHFRIGSIAEAERIARAILKRDKRNIDALLLLAQIYGETNRTNDCITMLSRAQALRMEDPDIAFNLGVALAMNGRHIDAIPIYRALLSRAPSLVKARINLAACLLAIGQPRAACTELRPLREADPKSIDVFLNLASAMVEAGEFELAHSEISDAPETLRTHGAANLLKARALNGLRRHEEAADLFRQLLEGESVSADAHNGLGAALLQLGRVQDAIAHLQNAIALDPQLMQAHHNLGHALHMAGRFEAALQAYDLAHSLAPAAAEPLYNKAMTLLSLGHFDEGWPLFEMRKKLNRDALGINRTKIRDLEGLVKIKGRRVLVDWEQGLGDTIQFSRFAKILADTGALVTLRVQPALRALVSTLDPRVSVIDSNPDPADFDRHVQTMSLPRLLIRDIANVPLADGYLTADPSRIEKWKKKIGPGGFKIGIAWQGNRQAQVDLGRSFSLGVFRPLAQIPGVQLISLQKNEGTEELAHFGTELGIETLGPDFDAGDQAFLDSAAALHCLDLLITSDTALAHLAGAIGRPVWVALKHVPDWRWLTERSDTPWYSSMRLFRQTQDGDWDSVFSQIEKDLQILIASLCSQ
jgi:tetratricopeptide (TPR) repeat protein